MHSAVDRYQKGLSGPLLDRIHLDVEPTCVEYEKLAADSIAESSATVRARAEAARSRQWACFEGSRVASNAEMGIRELKLHCGPDPAGEALLKAAVQRLGLSARAYHRVQQVARTIADLAATEWIGSASLAQTEGHHAAQQVGHPPGDDTMMRAADTDAVSASRMGRVRSLGSAALLHHSARITPWIGFVPVPGGRRSTLSLVPKYFGQAAI